MTQSSNEKDGTLKEVRLSQSDRAGVSSVIADCDDGFTIDLRVVFEFARISQQLALLTPCHPFLVYESEVIQSRETLNV